MYSISYAGTSLAFNKLIQFFTLTANPRRKKKTYQCLSSQDTITLTVCYVLNKHGERHWQTINILPQAFGIAKQLPNRTQSVNAHHLCSLLTISWQEKSGKICTHKWQTGTSSEYPTFSWNEYIIFKWNSRTPELFCGYESNRDISTPFHIKARTLSFNFESEKKNVFFAFFTEAPFETIYVVPYYNKLDHVFSSKKRLEITDTWFFCSILCLLTMKTHGLTIFFWKPIIRFLRLQLLW